MQPRLAVAAFVALLLAGCVSAPMEPPAAPNADATLRLESIVPVFERCTGSCYEPSIAVDSAGRVFVTEVSGRDLVQSADGQGFTRIAPPPNPVATTDGSRGDTLLATGPDGRLWYVALAGEVNAYPVRYRGIQVASSADGGTTWSTNAFVSRLQDPQTPAQFADRPWIAFGGPNTVYLSWFDAFYTNGVGPVGGLYPGAYELFVARSVDGGKTFSAPRQIHGVLTTNQGAMGGAPVVGPDGRLILPYLTFPTTLGGPPASVRVAISTDNANSFTSHPVSNQQGSRFAAITVAPDGSLALAWNGPNNALLVAASRDQATTWTPAARWNPEDQRMTASPWIQARADGSLDVVWYARTNESNQADLFIAHGPPPASASDRPNISLALAKGTRGLAFFGANTDFAHAARLPDGDLLVVWSDIEKVQAYVAHVGLAAATDTLISDP